MKQVLYDITESAEWRRRHPDQPISVGQIFTQPSIMGGKADPRQRMIFYQYRADRARRTLKGIDQQIVKAGKAVAGQTPVKRNRFVQLTGGSRSINRDVEAKARALAGLKGYITNLEAPTPEFVMGAYHQLWQIEKSFRGSTGVRLQTSSRDEHRGSSSSTSHASLISSSSYAGRIAFHARRRLSS